MMWERTPRRRSRWVDDAPKVDSPTEFLSSEGMDVARMSFNLDLRMDSSS
jgi:hypothetical protein